MSHIERMKQEHKELGEKLEKLNAFICEDERFNDIDEMEKIRMIKQSGFMQSYLEVLEARIWCNS